MSSSASKFTSSASSVWTAITKAFTACALFPCWAGSRATYHDQFDAIFDSMKMPAMNRAILRSRFQRIVRHTANEYNAVLWSLATLVNVITIGSVLVTAFTSIQKLSIIDESTSAGAYWTTLALSIVVVIASKLVTSFDLQKKAVIDKISLEKYKSEGWYFVAGTGRYDGKPLDAKFKLFIDRIEKLNLKAQSSMVTSDQSARDALLSSNDNLRGLYMSGHGSSGVAVGPNHEYRGDIETGDAWLERMSASAPTVVTRSRQPDVSPRSPAHSPAPSPSASHASSDSDSSGDNIDTGGV